MKTLPSDLRRNLRKNAPKVCRDRYGSLSAVCRDGYNRYVFVVSVAFRLFFYILQNSHGLELVVRFIFESIVTCVEV
jgi:hypothetical protein